MAAVGLFLIYCVIDGKKEGNKVRRSKWLLLFSGIAVWMTTSLFPWNFLQQIAGPFRFMVQNIQFPWRVLGISTLFLTFFACMVALVFKDWHVYGRSAVLVILIFALLSSAYFMGDRMTDNFVWYIQNEDSLDGFHYMGGEYIPENGEKANKQDTSLEYPDIIEVSGSERSYHRFQISCANRGEEESYIDVPLLYYRGYAAKDMDGGMKMKVSKSETGKVRITIPPRYAGNIYLTYQEYWYWRAAELVSVLFVFGMAVMWCIRRFSFPIPNPMKNNRRC